MARFKAQIGYEGADQIQLASGWPNRQAFVNEILDLSDYEVVKKGAVPLGVSEPHEFCKSFVWNSSYDSHIHE
jgi:hypothetical protein